MLPSDDEPSSRFRLILGLLFFGRLAFELKEELGTDSNCLVVELILDTRICLLRPLIFDTQDRRGG